MTDAKLATLIMMKSRLERHGAVGITTQDQIPLECQECSTRIYSKPHMNCHGCYTIIGKLISNPSKIKIAWNEPMMLRGTGMSFNARKVDGYLKQVNWCYARCPYVNPVP